MTMKDKKEFESFEESKSSFEVFSFSEKNNEKQFLNENFVFKAEDNNEQLGSDSKNEKQFGEESNSNQESNKKVEKQEFKKEDAEKFSKSQTASSTSGVSSTVATVASTATAAVVLVVGGSIAVGQTFEKPIFCELNNVEIVENTINYTLNIGNSEEEKILLEGGEECDVIVELLCPAKPEFLLENQVKNYGEISASFSDLEYDQTYSINVYQNNLLSLNKEYLLEEAYTVTIGQEMVNYFSFDAELDAFGVPTYYVTLTINDDSILGKHEEYYLQIDPSYDPRDQEIGRHYLQEPITERQSIYFDDLFGGVHTIALVGVNYQTQDYVEDILFFQDYDFDSIPSTRTVLENDYIYVLRESLGYTNVYYAYINTDRQFTQDDQLQVSIVQRDGDIDQEVTTFTPNALNEPVQFDWPDDNDYSEWGGYYYRLELLDNSGPEIQATLLFENLVDMGAIPTRNKNYVGYVWFNFYQTYYSQAPILYVSLSWNVDQDFEKYYENLVLTLYNETSGETVVSEIVYNSTVQMFECPGVTNVSQQSTDYFNITIEADVIATGQTEVVYVAKDSEALFDKVPEHYEGSVYFHGLLGEPYDLYASVYANQYSYYTDWHLIMTNRTDGTIIEGSLTPNEEVLIVNAFDQTTDDWFVEVYATNYDEESILVFYETIDFNQVDFDH